jgi:hypothetical protein
MHLLHKQVSFHLGIKVYSNLEPCRVAALTSNISLFFFFNTTSLDCVPLGKFGIISEGLMQLTSAALLFLRYSTRI